MDFLGLIPTLISEEDPRPVREQINENYAYGGGWDPMPGWTFDRKAGTIKYPGDEPLKCVAYAQVHGELVLVFPHAWVLVLDKDRDKFEVARMD